MNALTTPNKTLFISYSRKQSKWSDDLYYAIDEHTNYQRWRDNKIPISSDWWDSICLNIEGCYALIAIITQDYLNSVFCMGELEYALMLNKPVIALVLHDVTYPEKLDQQRLQFATVRNLEMRDVIIRVQQACDEIKDGYFQNRFVSEIHPRPHLRPPVPVPPKADSAPEEDVRLDKQVNEVRVHGQIPTRDLLSRFTEEKDQNISLARDLLNQLKERDDVSPWFDVGDEEHKLYTAEKQLAEEVRKREQRKKIRQDFDDMNVYVQGIQQQTSRIRPIGRFLKENPEFIEAQNLLKYVDIGTILPAPFDWIKIPAGNVTVVTFENWIDKQSAENKITYDVAPFSIAKYPVTNAQFRMFMQSEGYYRESLWTKSGWQYRKDKNLTEPNGWTDTRFQGDDKPVVGISWYEALAYCRWLSESMGENIALPSKQQWQRAAQAYPDGSDSQREYVWGNKWDSSACKNSVDSRHGSGTSTVTHYENKGNVSPCGVVDMMGNVWEWCLTSYRTGTHEIENKSTRCLCGGAWSSIGISDFRCDYWGKYGLSDRSNALGFRIVGNHLSSEALTIK